MIVTEEYHVEPCPFCAEKVDLRALPTDNGYEVISCANCLSYGPYGETIKEAIEFWNERVNHG